MKSFIALTILLMSTLALGQTPTTAPTTQQMNIDINGNAVTIAGKQFRLPLDRTALEAHLGAPDAEHKLANTLLTWNQLGLVAYVNKNAKVIQLSIALDPQPFKFWPTSMFSGRLTIDGAPVTSKSTVEQINAAKTGDKFPVIPDTQNSSMTKWFTLISIYEADPKLKTEGAMISGVSLSR